MRSVFKGCLTGLIMMLLSGTAPATVLGGNCDNMKDYELQQNLTNSSNTFKIQLQNLSMYDISLATNPFKDEIGGKVGTKYATILAPIGIPTKMPASIYATCSDPSVSPMVPMVMAYQDSRPLNEGYSVNEIKLEYLIKGVKAKDLDGKEVTADVPFTIDIMRCNPPKPREGDLMFIKDIMLEVYTILGVAVTPESPTAWIKAIWNVKKMIETVDDFKSKNTKETKNTVRISAYATMPQCSPGAFPVSGWVRQSDSVAAQTPQGCPPANGIIVTIMNIRGNYGSGDGENLLPVSIITVYSQEHFHTARLSLAVKKLTAKGTANADPRIGSFAGVLQTAGRIQLLSVADKIKGFSGQEQATLESLIDKLNSGAAINDNEGSLLERLSQKAQDCP